ncbi:TetR/AcrR family transcriptional regulator [Microbacterium resistens]|uniref:TetR/AcrR family transcriptional regulator n=1 Tax=Microbacterium resistens TaxID=156977 RepID=UPI00083553A7|nr:TetR/AcrR family transcriptional regulator [Microbacterium resistens]MBW1637948.1 TetR family transcriptional regulator [Microbacterium resistens]
MHTDARSSGRPRASSRETLAEAACELFLEQGYEATSIADITRRAGVSRSSFFNYFSSKSDVLWSGLDERIDAALVALGALGTKADGPGVRAALSAVIRDLAPDPLTLALRNASAMGVETELRRDSGLRHATLAAGVASAARAAGVPVIPADILGSACATAVLSAIRVWAEDGAGQASLEARFDEALRSIHALPWGP